MLVEINDRFSNRLRRKLDQQTDPELALLAIGADATGLDLRQGHKLFRLTLPAPTNSQLEFFSLLNKWL